MIISKTPLRISFLGGGTDYPDYYKRHGGATLTTSINQYTYVTVSSLAPFFKHSIGVHYSKVERVNHLDDIQHPAVRECLRFMGIKSGIEIHIATDLPARTGLGSSSSFTVGLLNALYTFKGKTNSNEQLAKEAVYIEQELIKERVGSQDQYACAFGGLRFFNFTANGIITSTPDVSHDRLLNLERHLMLFYTGIQRQAHEILDEQLENTNQGILDNHLNKMKKIVKEGIEILSEPKISLDQFGVALRKAWEIKSRFSSKVSNEKINLWYSDAIASGAIGGKLLGAGGGGFLLLFVPIDKQENVRNKLNQLQEVPFCFESAGSKIIFQTN